ncbi:carbohydrate ABC transporter permease [Pseudonocardia spinosispora]|uniref:carbohydrate ABC transporter permease n=1 Tax=Pseudonocardia spinosispora TaxID=103441 RepID=UPI0004007B87|nr:carbohydrate ABC transporter permease [Pseudonocardia spinosispora]
MTTHPRHTRALLYVARHCVLIGVCLALLLPLLLIIGMALMPDDEALGNNLLPHHIDWSNFGRVIGLFAFWRYLANSLLYSGLSTIGVLISSLPVAYALARLNWRGRENVMLIILATTMLPTAVTSVSLYSVYVNLGWIGTLKPLIVPTFFGDAFSIFLLRQFLRTIPQELIDAARVDGASELGILLRIIVPLAKPALVAVALFNLVGTWNDFFAPLVYSGANEEAWTLSVALSQFTQLQRGALYNLQMAGTLLLAAPILAVFLFAQRTFVDGITLTAAKR